MMVRQSLHSLVVTIAMAALAASCSKDPEAAKRAHFERGESYFKQEKYNEAIIEYRNAVQQDARYGEARAKLGETYLKVNNAPAALREYVRAADLLPSDAAVQLEAGNLLLRGGRFQDAKGRAEKLLALDPKSVDGHILHGNALAGLKDLKGAVAQVQEAIELDPKESRAYLTLGVYELARDKRELAEAAFRKAVEIAPQSAAAHLAMANFHWFGRNAAEAEQSFKKAIEVEPSHAVANRAMATFYLATQRTAEAEPFLKKLADEGQDAEPKLALADYYVATDRLPEAVAILKTLADDKNAFAAAKVRLATMEYSQGRKESAHHIVNEVLAREPKNPQILLLKGRLLLAERKLDEALASIRAATEAGPRFIQAHYTLGQVHIARQELAEATKAFNEVLKLNPRAAAAQVQISRLHLTRGGSEAAVQFAEEAVKNEPRSADAHLALAKGLLARGELARAEKELKLLMDSQPNTAVVHAQTGLLRLAKKDRAGAQQAFTRALELDPNHTPAMGGLVAADIEANQLQAARTKVEGWLSKTPNSAPVLLLAARVYAFNRDVVRAEQALRKVIEVDPAALEAYSALGQIYVATNRLDQALKEFEEFAKRQPKSIGAHTLVATILHTQNRIPEARDRYQRVLSIDSRSPVAANNLAWLYAETGGNLDVAVDLALTARARLPEVPAVNDTLGWVYYKKDRPRQAIPPLEESVAKEPTNALYQFHLGLAYAKAGEKPKARAALEQALKLNPQFAGSDEARRVLATVRG